jgi:putative hydrolase of the HAD superfamily
VIGAVIFDLDGTLVDHLGAQAMALDAGLERFGLSGGRDDLVVQWRRLERRHMDEFLAGECSFAEQRRRRLAAFLPLLRAAVPDDAANEQWWSAYAADYEAGWTLYPDVLPCLAAFRAMEPRPRLGVLTNGDSRQQRAKLARFELLDMFDKVVVSADIGVAKPHPDSFLTACRLLEVAPSNALFVGDWLELDALASIEAGLVGVWLDRAGADREAQCPHITSLVELPGVADLLVASA